MSELISMRAADASLALAEGTVSSVELTQAHLDRIEATESHIGAFLARSSNALEAARDSDDRRAAGEKLSPLAGIPIAIKDVLCTSDMVTTAGSRILEGWVPPYDATVVSKLLTAGMVALGKTNMDEFAMGSSTERSGYHPTHNPWDLTRAPGGSGGGSAAAVAAKQAPVAIGSDTGGSIRQPASFTGTVGVKPTYGGVSRYGVIALASSLDQVGPVSRTVMDSAMVHDVIAGHDPHDSTSIPTPWTSMTEAALKGSRAESLAGVRVGVVKELLGEGIAPGVRQRFDEALELLSAQGAEVVEVSVPHCEYAVAAYYLILPAEASSNLAKFDSVRFGMRVTPEGTPTVEDVMSATRDAGFGDEVKRRIILGTYALSAGYYDAYYGSAQKIRTLIQRDFAQSFEKVDVLLSPSTPTTAFPLGEKMEDPLAMWAGDVTTIPANLAGIPGMSLPMGLSPEDGLPVGLQLMAPAYQDARLYEVGAVCERLFEERDGHLVSERVPEVI
ncbi:MAG: Asp-tRNA(Asn)/Glu-tRNA(Gln) amidotransferase subunit GatA [Pontimonas sp.]